MHVITSVPAVNELGVVDSNVPSMDPNPMDAAAIAQDAVTVTDTVNAPVAVPAYAAVFVPHMQILMIAPIVDTYADLTDTDMLKPLRVQMALSALMG